MSAPSDAPLYGLALAGGRSRRMKQDKARLAYHGRPQVEETVQLLSTVCEQVYVSCRAGQWKDGAFDHLPQIHDAREDGGPAVGILSAMAAHPGAAWLVVACDLPFLDLRSLQELVAGRNPAAGATAYRSAHGGLPEPLCAIWEPTMEATLQRYLSQDMRCPRKVLIRENAHLLDLRNTRALDNVNAPEELDAARAALGGTR